MHGLYMLFVDFNLINAMYNDIQKNNITELWTEVLT